MDENRAYLVLTAVGTDRPGLVNELSVLVGEVGANIEDSRMAVLGGEFALIMLLSGSAGVIDRIRQLGPRIEGELGLRCLLKDTSPPHPPAEYLLYRIEVTGVDRPGIVHAIAGILADRDINVESLESRLTHAPFSATPMFVLEADLQVPSKTVLAELRNDLAATCEEENLDFRLEIA